MLQPVLIAPTPPTLHDSVVQRIEQALSELPGLGPVTGRAQWRRPDVPLGAADAYALYSSTLSLTGISDPELARRLGEQLRVDLLALAQPIFIACSVCEEGDQLWLMGLIVEARTGRIVFRAHSHAPVADDPQEMAGLAEAMAQDYLLDLGLAFQLRPHRQRFENLRPLAAR
ncbi:MAG TPA: hypothetical protein VGC20_04700 [bacterium]